MTDLLLDLAGDWSAQINGPRRGADRWELPGLAAAAKEQAARHGELIVSPPRRPAHAAGVAAPSVPADQQG